MKTLTMDTLIAGTRGRPHNLRGLLLAGALIPALALPPMQPSFAQAPDQQRPNGGMHPPHEGGPGMRGPGGGGHAPGEPKPSMRGEGAPGMRGPGGADHEPGEGQPHMRGEGGPGVRGPGSGREPGEGAAPMRGEGAPAERRAPAAERNAAPAPAPNGGGEPMRAQRRQERDDRAGRRDDDQAPRNGARDDNGPGGPGGPSDRNQRRMGGDHGPGPGDQQRMGGPGPGDRNQMGNDRAIGPGDRDQRRFGNTPDRAPDDRRRGGLSPAGAAAIGAAAGFAGGFMAGTGAARLDDIRRDRREVRQGDETFIREPGRTIVEAGDHRFITHDPNDRFRELGYRVNRERRGDAFVDTVALAGGVAILTFTTPDGRLLRRVRRGPDGREVVLFENGFGGRLRPLQDDIVVLPPPPLRIPRDRYVVDYAAVDAGVLYDTLIAPPLAPPPQRYTLDQVLYSPDIRGYVRSIDINTINFDTGSWTVPGDQTQKLVALGQAINRALDRNPNSVFLIEGYTDAVGNPNDNLSLSDRRAQSVAAILSKDFNVPPENLTTQGYGDQNLKEQTSGPSAANRRVVVRNITQLLASGGAPPQ